MNGGSDKQYTTAAAIAGAMIMGQLLFAGVCWWLYSSGARSAAASPNPMLLYVFLVVAISSIALALMLRGQIVSNDSRVSGRPATGTSISNKVVFMWAALEAASLLGLVFFFLEGDPTLLYAVLGYIVASAIFFFPRRDWFSGLL